MRDIMSDTAVWTLVLRLRSRLEVFAGLARLNTSSEAVQAKLLSYHSLFETSVDERIHIEYG